MCYHLNAQCKRLRRVCCSRDVPDPPTPKWHDSRSRCARHKARFRGKRLCKARALELYSYCPRKMQTTSRGFEPLRADPNGFQDHLLSRSDTVSCATRSWRLLSNIYCWRTCRQDVSTSEGDAQCLKTQPVKTWSLRDVTLSNSSRTLSHSYSRASSWFSMSIQRVCLCVRF